MSTTFKLTNEDLELRLKDFVKREKLLLHIILDHIKEIDRRKLYLERAYPSLFEYLVKELGYSGSAAMRRQQAARLLVDLPQLGPKIQSGSINLSQIGELCRAVKQKEKLNFLKSKDRKTSVVSIADKLNLIECIEGKSAQETQIIISNSWDLPILENERQRFQSDGSVRLEITFTQEQYDQLLKGRNMAAQAMTQKNISLAWGDVLTYFAVAYQNKNQLKSSGVSTIKNLAVKNRDVIETKALAIPSAKLVTKKQRQIILDRDLICQYRDPITQKLCGSTFALQVDHKIPHWSPQFQAHPTRHGPENLQILCAHHNRHKYQKECHMH
jgi:5-methylcytosine-specific restriction endonuclease McrA